jgi:hypothetical protein
VPVAYVSPYVLRPEQGAIVDDDANRFAATADSTRAELLGPGNRANEVGRRAREWARVAFDPELRAGAVLDVYRELIEP